ncbi:MAG: tetratricopeptide repeat protein [Bacteroidota bacterium]
MYYRFFLLLITGVFVSTLLSVDAQRSAEYHSLHNDLQKGIELFDQNRFSAAQYHFEQALEKYDSRFATLKAEASYYQALCAVRLFHQNADYLINKFIEEHPWSPRLNSVNLEMARHKFQNEDYAKAVEWFLNVDVYKIDPDEAAEKYFKTGFAYFKMDSFAKARVEFYQIIDEDTKYTDPALYYYSHTAYRQKNFETALNGFNRLKNSRNFGPIVPYYIIQVLYEQEKYQQIIDYAPVLMDEVTDSRKAEFARITGEAFYHEGKYDSASLFLSVFQDKADTITKDDYYRLGYVRYRLNEYDSAAFYFEKLSNDTSLQSQNALYHLGDCYLQMEEKEKAQLAFYAASSQDADTLIQRDALFNYAMLTYELSSSPFHDEVEAFTEYINRYPNSGKSDVAFKYLMLSYMSTNNYKGALSSIDRIKEKSEEIKKAYQRVAFYRAQELFTNLQFKEAIELYDKSLTYQEYDPDIAGKAHYWRAEAYYRLKEFDKAADDYNLFLKTHGALHLPNYFEAHYGLGYALFKQQDYQKAVDWFRKYIDFKKGEETDKRADACNRAADCYFVTGGYRQAVNYYEKAAEMNRIDVDYALFQKGFALGLLGKHQEKVAVLKQLLEESEQSTYKDDAMFQLGRAFVELNRYDSAEYYYQVIVQKHDKVSYISKALVNLGLIYYSQDNNDQALAVYERVVEEYEGTEDAKNALLGIKNIYMDQNDIDAYFAYVEALDGKVKVTRTQKDSLLYSSAEDVYMKGDCENALDKFERYIKQYPDGGFLINTYYYMADCYAKMNEYEKALEAYQFVTSKPHNIFTEEALLGEARMLYKEKNYKEAVDIYKRVEQEAEVKSNIQEARIRKMRAWHELNEYDSTIKAANMVLEQPKIDEEIRREAWYVKAKAYLMKEEKASALDYFEKINDDVRSEQGAEAMYWTIKINDEQGNKSEAKKMVYEFVDKNTPQRYWLGKAFILLADIFDEEGQDFQAIKTLKSLIDNYDNENDGIIEEARKKHDMLVDKENQIDE